MGKSSANLQRLNQGVFQVVVPRVEDDGVQYKEPLQRDWLPYDQRNDRFVGVGTAFAISPTRFVTAAHVFGPLSSSIEHYFVRNSTGVAHEIGAITKYSQYRDLAEFSLIDTPADVVALAVRGHAVIGERVWTVGNALGEGVVLREGSLTSLTPEPVDGRWKFLRFTAPASPGNSGGPLVDSDGRVLGIVVRKSGAENLNYAVPVDELDKLSSNRSEFWTKSIPFAEDRKQINFDWRFQSPLPTSLIALRTASEDSFMKTLVGAVTDFEAKFSRDIFPNHPNLDACLRESRQPFGFAGFVVDGNGKWTISQLQYKEVELARGQYARIALADNKIDGEVLLDRPSDMSLARFFESPRILADTIVHSLSWTLTFAGRKIGVESLGEPTSKEHWLDEYGRPWFTFTWPLKRSDSVLLLNCTTNPGGWACRWKRVSVEVEHAARMGFKRSARRTLFTYFGHLRDWEEFFQLPATHKPAILTNSGVKFDKLLKFKLGAFSGNVSVPMLSDRSVLIVSVTLDPTDRSKERISDVQLIPRRDKTYAFGIVQTVEPAANGSESYAEHWKKIRDGSPPFNNSLLVESNAQVIRSVSKLKVRSPLGDLYVHVCGAGSEDSKEELTAACKSFQESVKFDPGAGQ